MMRRRLKHKEWHYPQLFLIDGGRGQVRAVWQVFQEMANSKKGNPVISSDSEKSPDSGKDKSGDFSAAPRNDNNNWSMEQLNNIPIFGIAKREEWLYPPEGEVIKLPKRSLALRLVQKIRDESHRFAITYHKKLRSKAFLSP
jgi:excinuclease UvrABC nuclease subunit